MSKRFNINKNIEKLYVEIPKALIYEPRYRKQENNKGLSNEAKLLYGILLDKTYLSIFKAREDRNTKFIDENGDAFIYFDNASIEYVLQVSNKKAIQIKKELVSFNLLEEIQQGLGKANRLYLNIVEIEHEKLIQYVDNISCASKATNNVRKLKLKKWREEQSILKCKNYTTVENTSVQEIETPQNIENTMKCKNYTTEMYNLHISKTDFSKTDSVVVVNKGQYKKIPNRTLTDFEEIQINQNLTTSEKIKEIAKIKNINLKEIALLEKFIDSSIFISDAQFNMLKTFDYKIADSSINTTIAQGGETFSYFNKVYIQKEKEDIEDFTEDFMPLPNVKVKDENKIKDTEDFIFNPDLENEESFDDRAEAYKRCVKFNWNMDAITVKLSYKDAIEYAIDNNLEYPKL